MASKGPFPRDRVKPPNRTHPKTTDGIIGKKISVEKQLAFLGVLASPLGTPTSAARAIGIDRRTAYRWRNEDLEFRAAWDEAVEESIDALEGEAKRRGFEGVDKPVTIAGEREVVTEYSDTMLKLVLQGRRNNVFGNKTEVSGPEGGPIQHEVLVKFVRAGAKK